MEKIKIGLIGLGTVGCGVFNALKRFDNIEIKRIAVKNINKKRDIEGLDFGILCDDPFMIAKDREIDIVVEVSGGMDPTFDVLRESIFNRKHIITANKELLAKKGKELFELANKNRVSILYEAAIAGGIPIISPLKTSLKSNRIKQVEAILNGTTNYILTKMEAGNASYEEVLKEAQRLGYAESNPESDVEGFDSAYKICTLATIAFDKRVDINKIFTEGISKIKSEDINYAKELGYKIKLCANAKIDNDSRVDVRVHPTLVPYDHMLSKIDGVTNAVFVKGDLVSDVIFIGPGAGQNPTASSVVGDILILCNDLIASKINNCSILPMMKCNHTKDACQIDISETSNEYYMLIEAKNNIGVIGTIGKICGKNNINLETVMQKGTREDNTAEVVVITGLSKESDVQKAVCDLESQECINRIKNIIRVLNK